MLQVLKKTEKTVSDHLHIKPPLGKKGLQLATSAYLSSKEKDVIVRFALNSLTSVTRATIVPGMHNEDRFRLYKCAA